VYVLDISISMLNRLEPAKRELRANLASLQPFESFDIVGFCSEAQPFRNAMVPATPENLQQANGFLNQLTFCNGTNLQKALRSALKRPRVNLVVIITDGVPNLGRTKTSDLTKIARDLNRTGARIFTVGLVGRDPEGKDRTFEASQLLEQLARESNGQFKITPLG
jgi:Ca-activated chloride channel family protein